MPFLKRSQMDQRSKILKHLFNLYAGIQRENIKKDALLEVIKDCQVDSEEYKNLTKQIELITGNISMLDAVIQQQNRRLEELTDKE